MMKRREKEILALLTLLSFKSDCFQNPRIVMIGGYALRGYVPFSRYTRDCDFVLERGKEWNLDIIRGWIEHKLNIFSLEKRENWGFMRVIQVIRVHEKNIKVSLDFIEGKVKGREKEEEVI
jgi:hypothetical protein